MVVNYDNYGNPIYRVMPLSSGDVRTDVLTVSPLQGENPSEVDPNGKQQHEPGAKLDQGKAPVFRGGLLYFPRSITAIARVSAIGARKYAWKGWESVPDGFNRYSDALVRHLLAEATEELDSDTNCFHAEQVAWNACARLELFLKEKEKSDKG